MMLLLVWCYFQYQIQKWCIQLKTCTYICNYYTSTMHCFLFNVTSFIAYRRYRSCGSHSVSQSINQSNGKLREKVIWGPTARWGHISSSTEVEALSAPPSSTQCRYDSIKSVPAEKWCGSEAEKDEEEWRCYSIKKTTLVEVKARVRRWTGQKWDTSVRIHTPTNYLNKL